MTGQTETRFAKNEDVHLAYQLFGEGGPHLLLVQSWVHHVELVWDIPEAARFLRRLGSFGRPIIFDRRGTGMSDPVAPQDLPDLETQVDDALAVLDEAGPGQATVVGIGDGGIVAMLFAATHPDRCTQLVLFGTGARRIQGPDYPWGVPDHVAEQIVQTVEDQVVSGGAEHIKLLAPSRADDPRFVERFVQFGRRSVRPGVVGHYFRQTMRTDIRDGLHAIQAPTLVMNRVNDRICPVEHARYLAEHIPNAKLVELPGDDHFPFGDDVIDEIEEFVTGARTGPEPDRILATLLFTDIVGSTRLAAELGDRRWKELLDAHDVAVRRELERHRGREITTAGDGFFATFEGPARAIRCAGAIVDALRPLGIEVRTGVHTGECEVRGDDLGGLAVHIAARIAALAGPGEVLVSNTVKDLVVGAGISFRDRGVHDLKGVPGSWHLLAATP